MISIFKSFAVALASATSLAAAQPNLIIILADDMGYSDPGCFGGEISTPAIDKLAKEGVRLTHFRNGGMCVVSRASMLTGQWWPRGLRNFKNTPLLSETLQAAGYRTALVGKWHLAGQPLDRGFDHFFGFLEGFADHFTGAKSYRLDREPFTEFGPEYYSSDQFTDRAIDFIKAPVTGEKPFFLYLSYQAPHNPLQAPKADILKHRGKYLGGWQAVREARFRRQKEMGIVPADAVLPAYPENLPAWNSLTPEQRDLEDLRMAVYAAMVERMDQGIGRLMKTLEDSGKAANTQILFMSDNGADSFSVMDQALLKQGKLPGDPASNWQLGTGWAYASVTPWRLYKISQHGGGITTGAIAWRRGKSSGTPGRIDASALHMVDVMPTFLEIANASAKAEVAGESFAKLLLGKPWQRQEPLFFQYMDNRAIRSAEWTLAEVDGTGWELFNTTADPLETKNLAESNPELVAAMSQRWLKWWKNESGKPAYEPESTSDGPHYKPQGDKGSGNPYTPSAMPARLADRYPLP
ncbi:MAG: Arylsulfatase [Verrucomicrobiota bacterium]|jgi:arylsulfatase